MPNIKKNISLDDAQVIVKREGAIRAEETVYDGKTYIVFSDKNKVNMGSYCKEDKELNILTEEEKKRVSGRYEDEQERYYQKKYRNYLTHRGIFRQRFPDRKGLEEIEIRRAGDEHMGGATGTYIGTYDLGSTKHKPKIFLNYELKKGTPSYACILTHELVHHLRDKEKRWVKDDYNEEVETELESSCRGNIVDLKLGGSSYYSVVGYDKAIKDYRFLMNKNPPITYPELHVPLTEKIIKNIKQKGKKNLYI